MPRIQQQQGLSPEVRFGVLRNLLDRTATAISTSSDQTPATSSKDAACTRRTVLKTGSVVTALATMGVPMTTVEAVPSITTVTASSLNFLGVLMDTSSRIDNIGRSVAGLFGALKSALPGVVDKATVVLGVDHASWALEAGCSVPPPDLLNRLSNLFGIGSEYRSLSEMLNDPDLLRRFGNRANNEHFNRTAIRTVLRQTRDTFGQYNTTVDQFGQLDPSSQALKFLKRLRTEGPDVLLKDSWFTHASDDMLVRASQGSLKQNTEPDRGKSFELARQEAAKANYQVQDDESIITVKPESYVFHRIRNLDNIDNFESSIIWES